jgi:putative transposase
MQVTNKKEREEQGQEGKKPEIGPAIIEELMKGYQRPEDLTGPGGIMEQLTKRLYGRMLGAEMTHYLGYEKGQAPKVEADQKRENHRNGTSKKTIVSDDGKLEIEVLFLKKLPDANHALGVNSTLPPLSPAFAIASATCSNP